MKRIALLALAAGAVVLGVVVTVGGATSGELAAIEGPDGEVVAADGARLERRADGIAAHAVIPTPTPGSYTYPEAKMVPKWSGVHPAITPGSERRPEAFTLWVVIFNRPELCTDVECGADDLEPDAPARGGVFLADGRIASDSDLEMTGAVRLGQQPSFGSPLAAPLGAEIHFAIAPHGKALSGRDLWRQLNGPVGNPSLWWSATFAPSE